MNTSGQLAAAYERAHCTEVSPRRDIEAAYSELSTLIEKTSVILEQLENRLTNVRKPSPPAPANANCSAAPEPVRSPVGERLTESGRQINNILLRIVRLNDEVQI